MSLQKWIYHAEHEPKIINVDEFDTYNSGGWEDSPAKCEGFTSIPSIKQAIKDAAKTGESHGLSKKKAKNIAVHQTGQKIQKVADSVNEQINSKSAIKKAKREIEKKILKEFNEDVDLRSFVGYEGLRELQEYYKELKNGDNKSD